MSHLLVTNDDGVDSPALAPLARALAGLGTVEVVVPDRERSWVSKAVTRHEEVHVDRVEKEGIPMWTTTGYPADCAQLGIHGLVDHLPRAVISGINIGFNFGAAYLLSSGTIGAASEAAISGLPAFAFSTGTVGDWPRWARWARSHESLEMWQRLAEPARDIVDTVLSHGFPDGVDLINVNLPEHADSATDRVMTEVARVGYDRLFSRANDTTFVHDFGGDFTRVGDVTGTDIGVATSGAIAITPLRIHETAAIPPDLRTALRC